MIKLVANDSASSVNQVVLTLYAPLAGTHTQNQNLSVLIQHIG
jgi:hypothetical protein